jgi:hypothetical protein
MPTFIVGMRRNQSLIKVLRLKTQPKKPSILSSKPESLGYLCCPELKKPSGYNHVSKLFY